VDEIPSQLDRETSFGPECEFDPLRRECVVQYATPTSSHACDYYFQQWMAASFFAINRTVGMGLRTRNRVPSISEFNDWGGTIAFWWYSMFALDRCIKQNGRPQRGGPYAHRNGPIPMNVCTVSLQNAGMPA
jgi:hypothetical protein